MAAKPFACRYEKHDGRQLGNHLEDESPFLMATSPDQYQKARFGQTYCRPHGHDGSIVLLILHIQGRQADARNIYHDHGYQAHEGHCDLVVTSAINVNACIRDGPQRRSGHSSGEKHADRVIHLVEGIAYFRPNLDSIRFLGARCKLDRRLVLTRSQMRSSLADGLFEIPQP